MKKIKIIASEIYHLEKEYEVDDEDYESLLTDESLTVDDFVEYDLYQDENRYGYYQIEDECGNLLLKKKDEPDDHCRI